MERASPSRCAEQLESGEVDVGLIPSIEYQRIPGLAIVPGIAVAASSDVRSVLMVRPKGLESIRSVALDTSSRSSVVLLKLLLCQRMGLSPEFIPHPPDLDQMLRRCDAALIIGDAALRISMEKFDILDLARAWIEWQKMPFVFAFWACREGPGAADLVQAFHQAREWGLKRREKIAEAYARELGLPRSMLADYLERNIDYDFAESHKAGLERYYVLARESGLIAENRPLRFLPLHAPVESPIR